MSRTYRPWRVISCSCSVAWASAKRVSGDKVLRGQAIGGSGKAGSQRDNTRRLANAAAAGGARQQRAAPGVHFKPATSRGYIMDSQLGCHCASAVPTCQAALRLQDACQTRVHVLGHCRAVTAHIHPAALPA